MSPMWDTDRPPAELVGVRIPDTPAARAAGGLIDQHADSMLGGHSVRSFLFASMLGTSERTPWDEEALYVGCILHDIGLTAAFDHDENGFEHVSAETAATLTERFDWPRARRENVARSIVMHMAHEVDVAESVETRLLAAGVSCDVSGSRITEIDPRTTRAVLQQFPRRGFKPAFSRLMQHEAIRKPASAAASLVAAGLLGRIHESPFEDSA